MDVTITEYKFEVREITNTFKLVATELKNNDFILYYDINSDIPDKYNFRSPNFNELDAYMEAENVPSYKEAMGKTIGGNSNKTYDSLDEVKSHVENNLSKRYVKNFTKKDIEKIIDKTRDAEIDW